MNTQRVRAFAVTVALVLGAGTMSAVAALLLRSEAPPEVNAPPSQAASEAAPAKDRTEEARERTAERAGSDKTDHAKAARRARAPKAKQASAKGKATAAAAKAKPKIKAQGKGKPPAKAAGAPQGRGNAHGKTVSAAARGQTPPVGNCRNHGHWVSTVAKGKASCDDNPRRPKTDD